MSMSESRGSKSATEIRSFDDALSLDDLDKVVGGSDALPRREGEYYEGYSPSGEGGYTPPPPPPPVEVNAPDDLPPELAAIEANVANDTWTGQQAVTQITSLVGQGDHSLQSLAGAEIATLIARGEVTSAAAMSEIHNAVTNSHTLTAEQAVGLLAGIMVGQYTTDGIDASVGEAARNEISSLVTGNQISANDAITALAAAAGDAPVHAQNWVLSPIASFGLPAAQVVDDISAALDANLLTGTELVNVLTMVAGSSYDPQMTAAVGTEIGQLVADQKITAAEAMAGMHAVHNAGWLAWMQALPILGAAVDANGALAAAAGAEFGSMLNAQDSWGASNAANQLRNLVTSNVLSADEAVVMLAGMADAGHASSAAQAIVNVYVNNHLSVAQVMADIQNAVAANELNGMHAVNLLYNLGTSGYGSSFSPSTNAAIGALITQGEVAATEVTAAFVERAAYSAQYFSYGSQYVYSFNAALGALMTVAATDAPGADVAVTAALAGLIAGGVPAATVVSSLAGQLGNGALAGPIAEQVMALLSAHALTADAAVTALALGTNGSMSPDSQIAHAIGQLIQGGQVTAAQAMADIAAIRYELGDAVNLMALVAGQNPSYIAAAAIAITGMLNDWYTAESAMGAIHQALTLTHRMPMDLGIALLTALAGDGTTGGMASAVGNEFRQLISQNHITATQAMAGVHAAVTGRALGVDAAVALLANAAAGASSAVQMAINTELSALISGELISAAHAGEVLRALAAASPDNAALQSAINNQLGVVGSADPSTGIFSSLDTTANLATLNGAADQLYALIQSGQTSAQAVMATIDQALSATPPTLTNTQAISLLIGIGGHDDLETQAAAGEQLAKVFAASGPITNMSWAGLKGTFGDALDAGTLTNQEAVGMLLGAIGAPGTTDAVRSTVQTVLAHIIAGDWQGTYLYRPPMPASTLASTIDTMLAAHVLTGPEAIRVAFVMTGDYRLERFANEEIVALISSGRVTGAEIHSAITSGWWRVDAAVMTLAGISESPAALGEISALVADGTITAARLISALHPALTPNPDYMAPRTTSVYDVVRVFGAIAATGTPDAISAIGTELVSVLKAGQISNDQLNTLLAGAGASRDAVVENVLGQLGALATNIGRADLVVMALVNAHVTTLDHALGAITASAGMVGVSNVLNLAVLYDGLSTGDANAAIVAMVGANTISANDAITLYCKLSFTLDAGAGIQALIANGNISAGSAINAIIGSPDLTRLSALNLLGTFASSTDPTVQSAVCDGIISLNYGSPTPDQTVLTLLNMAGENATWGTAIAGHLMYLVNNGGASVAMIDAMIGYAMGHGLPVGHAMPIIAQVGALVPAADRAAFFGDITAMVADGRATAAQGVAALAGVAMSADPTLQQSIGAQLLAIVNGDASGQALHGIGDAITGNTLTGAQATALLIGMTTSWNVPAAVVAEIDALLDSNKITAAHVISAVDNAVTAGTLTAAGAIMVLAHFVSENASLNQAAAREIGDLISAGKIGAQQVMIAINGTIGNPLDRNEVMALFGGMANSGQYDGGALNSAIVTNIATLVFANGIQVTEAVAGIRHAVVAGTITADQAVTLLAGMAAQGDAAPDTEFRGAEMHDAAIAAISEVISGALNSFQSIIAAFGTNTAANLSMLAEIAGHANAGFQAQYGSYIAQQVATGALTPDQVIAAVNQLNVDDTITPTQALTLYANISAAVARQPNASELNAPLNAAISALISNMSPDDDHMSGRQAIALLQELGANGGADLAVITGAKIEMLLGDPRTLITSAATAGIDMNEAGAKLAAMVNAGQIGAWEAANGIAVQTMAGGAMTGAQATAFLLSVIAHGTADGWAVNHGNPGATNWQALASSAFAQFENYGVAPSVIINGIHTAVASFELTGPQAGILLAGLIGHADLREAATSEMVRLLNDNGQARLLAADAIAAIVNTVSTGYANPGVLTPALAVDVLVAMSVNAPMPGDRGLIAAGLAGLPGLEADQLVEAISGAIAAHAMTGAQALAILLPVATAGDGTVRGEVGQALAALVESHQIALTDIRNSIRTDVITPDTVLVVLTGMIGLTDGVMAAIDDVCNAWGMGPDRTIAALHDALSARTIFGEGASANQVMHVLATLPTSYATEITNEIGSLMSQNLLSRYGAVAALAEAAGEGTADMQRTVAAVFANMMAQAGHDARFGTTISDLVPGSMTADQAIAVFAAMSIAPATGNASINLDALARNGINTLIANGHISPQQAMADIVGGLTSLVLTADQTVGLIAGVATSAVSAQTPGVLIAAGQVLNSLFASGQVSVAQAMADIDRALAYQWMYQTADTSHSVASYDAGGLTAASAPALLAAVMAAATDIGVINAASAALMTIVNSHRISPAEAMSGIHGAVTSGALTAAQALHVLASIGPGSNTDMQAAIAVEMSNLVNGGSISATDAVASLAAMANSGDVRHEVAAGQAIAALVAQGAVTVDQAIAGIRGAVDAHTLGANNALAALVGLSVGGSEALRDAAHDAIVAIVAANPGSATAAFTSLEDVARQSNATVSSAVGNALAALIGGNLLSVTDAMSLVRQASMGPDRIGAMLAGIAGNGDMALQAAVGREFANLPNRYAYGTDFFSGITVALAAGNLTPDQAVVMLAAAIPSTTVYVQAQMAGQIATLVSGGQINAAQVMTDIHSAVVSHVLSAEQALAAMAYIAEVGASDLRLAVVAETSNLVTSGQILAVDVLDRLITLGRNSTYLTWDGAGRQYTSTTLLSMTGGMVASLIDGGQLTADEFLAGINNRSGFDDYSSRHHTMALLMGVGVNGGVVAQSVAGESLASLVQAHAASTGDVLAMIDSAIVSHTVTSSKAVTLMTIFAGALPDTHTSWACTQVAAEVRSLVDRGLVTAGEAFNAMFTAATNNPAAAMASGAGIGTLWTNDNTGFHTDVIRSSDIRAAIGIAVRDGLLSGPEAITMLLGIGLASTHATDAGTQLANMIRAGQVTAEQVVGTLAVIGVEGTSLQLATVSQELLAAMPAAQAVDLIGNLIEAHTITDRQGIALLASFAATGTTATQLAVGHEIASLLTQGALDAVTAMNEITRAVHNNTIPVNEAVLMLAGAIVGSTAAVQAAVSSEIAQLIAFNRISVTDTMLTIRGAIASQDITADQALGVMANLAATTLTGYPAIPLQAAFAAEVAAQIAAGITTAAHAIEVLAGIAGEGSAAVQAVIGQEIGALIIGGQITAVQAMATINATVTSDALTADQAVALLAKVAAVVGTSNTYAAFTGAIATLVASGEITAAQAMADIGAAVGVLGAWQANVLLFAIMDDGSWILREAAAVMVAELLGQGHDGFWYGIQRAINAGVLTVQDVVGVMVQVAFHCDAAQQSYVNAQLLRLVETRGDSIGHRYAITPEWAVVELLRISQDGSAAFGLFIGREFSMLLGSRWVQLPVEELIIIIDATVRPIQVAPGVHAPIDPDRKLSGAQVVMVLEGMLQGSLSAENAAAVTAELEIMFRHADPVELTSMVGKALADGAMTADQAMQMFSDIWSRGVGFQNAVVHEIATLYAQGLLTVEQVTHGMSTHSVEQQLTVVTGLLREVRGDITPFAEQYSKLMLQGWGVSTTSAAYGTLQDALAHVAVDYAAIKNNQMTSPQVLADLRAYAAAHSVSADILIASMWSTMQLWAPGAAANVLMSRDLTNDMVGRLHAGEISSDIADMVLNGSISMVEADAIMREIAIAATPLNPIAQQVIDRQMSVGYANEHHPGWANNSWHEANTVATAIALMHIDVRVPQCAEAVANGTMTAAAAAQDILNAAGASDYAADLGLTHLADALHAAGNEAGRQAVVDVMGPRMSSGESEVALSQMVAFGWISPQQALDLLEAETEHVISGLPADEAEMMSSMFLARLDMAASGLYPVNAGVPALEAFLESTQERKLEIAQGAGTLMTIVGGGNPQELQGCYDLIQQVIRSYVRQEIADEPPPPPGAQSHYDQDKFTQIAQLVGDKVIWGVEMAVDKLIEKREAIMDGNKLASIIGRECVADVNSARAWVNLGAEITATGIPGLGAIAGIPSVQSYLLNQTLGEGAGMTFTAVSLGSMVAVQVLTAGAVAGAMEDAGAGGYNRALTAGFKAINATCGLISGTISGTIHTYVDQHWQVGEDLANMFGSLGSGDMSRIEQSAEELGRQMFLMTTGVGLGEVAAFGTSLAEVIVDLTSGDPQDLERSAAALGHNAIALLESNPYLKMAGGVLNKYADTMSELQNIISENDRKSVLITMFLLGL